MTVKTVGHVRDRARIPEFHDNCSLQIFERLQFCLGYGLAKARNWVKSRAYPSEERHCAT